MITAFDARGGLLVKQANGEVTISDDTVWIDLVSPTPEEDSKLEKLLSIDIPTRDEMREIEVSNRLYIENGTHYMTALIVYNVDQAVPESSVMTFILHKQRLVTVRYYQPKSIPLFIQRIEKGEVPCSNGAAVAIGLIETLISRKADLIERVQDEIDGLASGLFDLKGGQASRSKRYEVFLRSTGRYGDAISRAHESAHTLDRLLLFFADAARDRGDDARIIERIRSARSDVQALMDNMKYLSTRIGFLLEAVLGMISTDQNQIIKLFSVMAVMFLPPTLIASIYGMNFDVMPELRWVFGYPAALGLMVISAIVPLIYFKRKGWF